MNAQVLPAINSLVKANETSTTLSNIFSRRSTQKSPETNLMSFWNFLSNKGHRLNREDYIQYFEDMEGIEAGHLVYDGGNPIKFIWKYNFQDIANKIQNPNRPIELRLAPPDKTIEERAAEVRKSTAVEIKENLQGDFKLMKGQEQVMPVKKRGRPKGSKNLNMGSPSTQEVVQSFPSRRRVLKTDGGIAPRLYSMDSSGVLAPVDMTEVSDLLQKIKDKLML